MSDVTKPVDRGIPIQGRTQSFTQADAGAGDVLMIEDSLGRSAKVLTIESAGGMQIRVNVYHMVAPPRMGNDLMYTEGMNNLALAQRVKNDSQALINIEADETFVLDDGLIIKDMELVTVSGVFEILVS
jgi:hypothetical protein